jgi:cell wall-associated NlpC family hydrolase
MEQVLSALNEVTRGYGDTRTHYCRLEVVALDEGRCALAGAVLDEDTLRGVIAGLGGRVLGIDFDISRVRILRAGATRAVVATSLTGLYAVSSFLAEQVSQLLNGWTVEVLLEEGRWRFVRLADGYLGWAYGPYMAETAAPAPTHIVCEPVSLLRMAPSVEALPINRILGGTAVEAEAHGNWAKVVLAGDPAAPLRPGLTGWMPTAELRSLSKTPADEAGRRAQIIADAVRFTGVPYLWGGCSAFGIDCSGYAQQLHRLAGVAIPRDADQQFDAGRPVEYPYQAGDLLFFGEGEDEARKITHVAVSLGGWRILHSSRSRNGVQEDDVQDVEHLRESFVGARTFVANGKWQMANGRWQIAGVIL